MSNLNAALYYASLGMDVFWLPKGGKVPPKGFHWKDEATRDRGTIEGWFNANPDANIGIACGKRSGISVIDIDLDESMGKNGFKNIAEFGAIPQTWICVTQRGGWHCYFRAEECLGNATNVIHGVDIRGESGYVLAPPSVADIGEYQWHKDYNPWTVELASWPAWMPRTRLNPAAPPAPPRPVAPKIRGYTLVDLNDPEVIDRIMAYFGRVEGATQGSSGHSKLLWAAQCCVNGLKMTVDQAKAFLWEHFNPRCNPPWNYQVERDRKDFERKPLQAKSNPVNKPYGWIVDDPEFAPPEMRVDISKLDIDAFMDAGKVAEKEAQPLSLPAYVDSSHYSEGKLAVKEKRAEDKELRFLCRPHGLVGDIVSYINSQGNWPQPWLAVGAALSFCGMVFGRKVCDQMNSRTNIYTLGIGPSSCGKNNALLCIRELATRCRMFDNIGGDDVTSASAIESQVFEHPSTLFLWDEIGHILKSMKSGNEHKAGIIPFLMRLYSLAGQSYKGKSYADSAKNKTIVQPCVSFYGTSTTERLQEGVSVEELEDGWIARVLMFMADPEPIWKSYVYKAPPMKMLETLVTWRLRDVKYKRLSESTEEIVSNMNMPASANSDPAPNPVMYEATPDAETEYAKLRSFARNYDGEHKTLWLKAEETARRVGLIMAAGRSPKVSTIEKIDANYAVRVVRYCIGKFVSGVAHDVGSELHARRYTMVKKWIVEAGINGLTQSMLTRNSRSWAKEAKQYASSLCEANFVFTAEGQKGRNGIRTRYYVDMKYFGEYEKCEKK